MDLTNLTKMSEVLLTERRVLIREDLNVPLKNGQVTDDTRIQSALPTIKFALDAGAQVMVMSHLGRPQEGKFEEQFSLAPIATALNRALNCKVDLARNYLQGVQPKTGRITLLENVRFNAGEKANDIHLSQQLAALCDVFVMDAFAVAHRLQASTAGVAEYAPVVCAGPLLYEELQALGHVLEQPEQPVMAIVGGSKVSTKMRLLDHLLEKVDKLIVGGGIANTFLKAAGYNIGKSLYEAEFIPQTQQLIEKAKRCGVELPLPTDVAVANEFNAKAKSMHKNINQVNAEELILDVGPQTAAHYAQLVAAVKTIIWNGPLGVCEFPQFATGTHTLAQAIASSKAYSIAGGGDTITVLNQFGLIEEISYISTGGGAFLTLLEKGTLPAVEI